MLIRVGYEISVNCWQPTAMVAMMSVRDERMADIRVAETFTAAPDISNASYRDLFGNLCRRFTAPAGDLTLRSEMIIEDSGEADAYAPEAEQHAVCDLPDDCLVYLMGSRYCETDSLSQLAWNLFGNAPTGWARVQAISDFVHQHIVFNYQNARSTRTAAEAHAEQTGVCRDYAHLGIALCRAMNIPARYVNGYLPDIGVPPVTPMDFSAWIEVYLSGRWWTFDPRNNVRRIGRVPIAYGRDAADVAMLSSFGPHVLTRFNVVAEEVKAQAA